MSIINIIQSYHGGKPGAHMTLRMTTSTHPAAVSDSQTIHIRKAVHRHPTRNQNASTNASGRCTPEPQLTYYGRASGRHYAR